MGSGCLGEGAGLKGLEDKQGLSPFAVCSCAVLALSIRRVCSHVTHITVLKVHEKKTSSELNSAWSPRPEAGQVLVKETGWLGRGSAVGLNPPKPHHSHRQLS